MTITKASQVLQILWIDYRLGEHCHIVGTGRQSQNTCYEDINYTWKQQLEHHNWPVDHEYKDG